MRVSRHGDAGEPNALSAAFPARFPMVLAVPIG